MNSKDPARFMAKVSKKDNGCWEWAAGKSNKGYGRFRFDHKTRYAHRVSYEHFVGPVLAGLQLDHLCRNRWCCNPAHLEPVTPAENSRRGETGIHMRNKTHCPQGHPYSTENTGIRNGERHCRACARAHYHAKKKSDQIAQLAAQLAEAREALAKIAGLDYRNAATNGAAYSAHQIASAFLAPPSDRGADTQASGRAVPRETIERLGLQRYYDPPSDRGAEG